MSGHSHFKSIKHKKGLADAKKSKAFSKISRLLSVAVREGGSDITANPKLRMAVEKAKYLNMPAENIERAIKKGSGELEGVKLESITLEAYGPGNVAIIIEGITDNKNRALSEIKQVLNQNQGKIAGEGSVKWLFERKGVIEVLGMEHEERKKEDLEIMAIEAGAEDISWHNNIFNIYTKSKEVEKVKKNLKIQGIEIGSVSLDWVPKEYFDPGEKDEKSCQKLFEAIGENDAVQEMYSNLKI